jgi:MOSC domain-containing protein YiiM
MRLLSVNIGKPRPNPWKPVALTGIDKHPVSHPVMVTAPGPRGTGDVGLAGDRVYDAKNHGGTDQAVYAYAREDLDGWAAELGTPLRNGVFGENLTTEGVDVTGAVIGERWRIGPDVVLEVCIPRIPCGTFQGWLARAGWIKRFTAAARPGTYLRVIEPGLIRAGDPAVIEERPAHDVTVAVTFRALTTEPGLLPRLLAADALPDGVKELARKRIEPAVLSNPQCDELSRVRQHTPARGNPVAVAVAAAGLVLAVFGVAGCSTQPDALQPSVEACTQFAIAAIRNHVTVTTLPAACRSLTPAQVDSAAGTALRSADDGVRDKALKRQRIAAASRFIERMFVAVPAQRSAPQASSPAAGWISRTALGLTALCAWLVTVALGLAMMLRWVLRSRARHSPGSRFRRPPALNVAHLGLAGAGLLIWIAYLATGLTGLAWTATALLTVVIGLGMTLVFFLPSQSRHPSVVVTGAHIVFATTTFLFVFLTAIGTG